MCRLNRLPSLRPSDEQLQSDRFNVISCATTMLSRLALSTLKPTVIHPVASSCGLLWTLLASTPTYASRSIDYKYESHVIVVLNRLRVSSIQIKGQIVAPMCAELIDLFSGPRDFTRHPYNLATQKYTQCEKFFRSCMRDLAQQPDSST